MSKAANESITSKETKSKLPHKADGAGNLSRRSLMNMLVSASAVAGAAIARPSIAKADDFDPVFRGIASYLAAYSEAERCLEKAASIESEIWAIADAAAQPRMKTRLDFEIAHPDHVFSSSKDELL